MSEAWPGLSALAGGKAYVATSLGQLHFRDAGPRDSQAPFLLLHQSPQFMIEFGAIQNALAARGVRSVAVDTPGYGMSDSPPGTPGIGDLADNLLPLLDLLGLTRVIAAGHHTGACIAAALAARHPARVGGVILHGCPVYSADEAARFRNAKTWELGALVPDGSHLLHIFARIPPRDPGEILVRTWMSAGLLLQASDGGHFAVNDYDMAADLRTITAPGMIITERNDVTHVMDQRAHALRPDFDYRVLGETGTSAVMTDPEAWVDLAMEFRKGS